MRTKTDTDTSNAVLRFLEEAEADDLSDRAIARRFNVGHPKVARARAARRRSINAAESPARSIDRVEHNSKGHLSPDKVEHKLPRPSLEASSTRLADVETRFAREAIEAWVRSFDPPTPAKPPLDTPSLREFREWLAQWPPGVMPDLPDFLDRRRR
jgi:hypothetical protein